MKVDRLSVNVPEKLRAALTIGHDVKAGGEGRLERLVVRPRCRIEWEEGARNVLRDAVSRGWSESDGR